MIKSEQFVSVSNSAWFAPFLRLNDPRQYSSMDANLADPELGANFWKCGSSFNFAGPLISDTQAITGTCAAGCGAPLNAAAQLRRSSPAAAAAAAAPDASVDVSVDTMSVVSISGSGSMTRSHSSAETRLNHS